MTCIGRKHLGNIHRYFSVASEDQLPPNAVISVVMWVLINPQTRQAPLLHPREPWPVSVYPKGLNVFESSYMSSTMPRFLLTMELHKVMQIWGWLSTGARSSKTSENTFRLVTSAWRIRPTIKDQKPKPAPLSSPVPLGGHSYGFWHLSAEMRWIRLWRCTILRRCLIHSHQNHCPCCWDCKTVYSRYS